MKIRPINTQLNNDYIKKNNSNKMTATPNFEGLYKTKSLALKTGFAAYGLYLLKRITSFLK